MSGGSSFSKERRYSPEEFIRAAGDEGNSTNEDTQDIIDVLDDVQTFLKELNTTVLTGEEIAKRNFLSRKILSATRHSQSRYYQLE